MKQDAKVIMPYGADFRQATCLWGTFSITMFLLGRFRRLSIPLATARMLSSEIGEDGGRIALHGFLSY